MVNESIEMRGQTNDDGILNLTVNVGVADAEVAVTVHVRELTASEETDANGWPIGFVERVAGSMPELQRPPQGEFEDRVSKAKN